MEIKPTSFARGVPPEERNGFFGIEGDLIAAGESGDAKPIVAVVTYVIDEVVSKSITGVQYPVVKVHSIEPLHSAEAIAAAEGLRSAAMKDRTGMDQLDLPEVED